MNFKTCLYIVRTLGVDERAKKIYILQLKLFITPVNHLTNIRWHSPFNTKNPANQSPNVMAKTIQTPELKAKKGSTRHHLPRRPVGEVKAHTWSCSTLSTIYDIPVSCAPLGKKGVG